MNVAAIREMYPSDPNRFDLVAIPRADKGSALKEEEALVLARIVCMGVEWDGEMKMSGFWQGVRGSMESNVREFDDHEMQEAGIDGAKKYIAVKESKWHADHDKAWDKVKQEPCFTDQSPRKYRVQVKDREGWWRVTPKGSPLPLELGQYELFKQACENQHGNPDLKTDRPGGMLFLRAYSPNLEKFKAMVGKVVRWELRPTPVS